MAMRPVTGRPDAIEQAQIRDGVGALIKQLRREQGMGIRDLQRRSGVSRATVSRLELGLRRPRRSTLGWIAWGLDVSSVKAQIVEAAGLSLVAESSWSERTHRRHMRRALAAGAFPVPLPMLAPYAVAALGGVLPDEVAKLAKLQEMARRGEVPWPEGLAGSSEALAVGNALTPARRSLP